MKTVYFIRHAKSSWEDPSLHDIDRPLNKRGLRDAPFMAAMLKGKGIIPDRIISSPANRALSTAKYFADAFGIDDTQIEISDAIYEAYSRDVITLVQHLPDELQTVLIFGHNPTFTSIANFLGGDQYIPNVPTCGIVEIKAEVDQWHAFNEQLTNLTAFYYPKQYF